MKKIFVLLLGGVVLLLICSPSIGQVKLGIGLRGGLTSVEDPIGTNPMFGGHLTLKVTPKIHLETMVEYFSNTYESNQLEVSWKNLYAGATASYNFDLPRTPLTPYLGIGMCMHRITQTFSSTAPGIFTPSDKSSIEGCFHILGGLKLNFTSWPLQFFIEARYMAVGDNETPNLASILTGFIFSLSRR